MWGHSTFTPVRSGLRPGVPRPSMSTAVLDLSKFICYQGVTVLSFAPLGSNWGIDPQNPLVLNEKNRNRERFYEKNDLLVNVRCIVRRCLGMCRRRRCEHGHLEAQRSQIQVQPWRSKKYHGGLRS